MRVLFLLFIGVPIIEMWLLISVGQQIGAIPTIGLVLLTAFIGVALLRYQGAMALLRARLKMGAGEVPAREMADALFFAVGGALLLTPGFVTDAIGFACLTPGIRTVVIGFFAKHIITGQAAGHRRTHSSQTQGNHDVLEGDFERHND